MRRLLEADVIFYDRLVDPGVLELARRDAERVFAGKTVGANAWPQDRIDPAIVAEARRGRRVVRLKSGDPSIFGRATQEMSAARAAGIPCEIVPGVTAASAAASALGRPLTERGGTDRLLIATGTCRPGDPDPDWAATLSPGTTLALYMAAGRAGEIAAHLRSRGLPGTIEVEIAGSASTERETLHRTDLASLGDVAVAAPALLLLRRPKGMAARHPSAAACASSPGAGGSGSVGRSNAPHYRVGNEARRCEERRRARAAERARQRMMGTFGDEGRQARGTGS